MLKELVEWTTDLETRSCVGMFVPEVSLDFIKKELQNAPIEKSNYKSRLKKAYADKYLVIHAQQDLENEDLGIEYTLLEKTTFPEKPGYKTYKFDLKDPKAEEIPC